MGIGGRISTSVGQRRLHRRHRVEAPCGTRDHLMEKLQPLWPHFQSQRSRACEVTVGSAQARDKPELDRVTRGKEDNWDFICCNFCGQNRRRRWRDNYSYLATNKIGREFW